VPEDRFQVLARYLLDYGIDPKFAARIGSELRDHYADLELEALAAQRTPTEAAAEAQLRIGDEAAIAEEFIKRPELRAWLYRYALILRCLGFVVALIAAVVALIAAVVAPIQALVNRSGVLFRYATAVAAAFVVTAVLLFGLQLAMRYNAVQPEHPDYVRVALTDAGTAVIIEEFVTVRGRSIPQRPAEGNQQPGQPADYEFQILADTSRAVDIAAPGLADGEYLPIVKVAPVYPALAASQGLEGYVVVEFTVTPAGTVRDVVVVESSSELFNQAAVEATHKFKYKPRVVSGRPVEVSGVRNKITFVVEA
jgi:periplasmic protein TonB